MALNEFMHRLLISVARRVGNARQAPPHHPGGPSAEQANALTSFLNSPGVADMMMQRRTPFARG